MGTGSYEGSYTHVSGGSGWLLVGTSAGNVAVSCVCLVSSQHRGVFHGQVSQEEQTKAVLQFMT